MTQKVFVLALVAAVVGVAGAAQADDGRERPDFATLDANGDGVITQEELQAHAAARFASVDTNGDGGLSAEELIAAAGERAADRTERMIARADENGDGLIQQDEMRPRGGDRLARMFARVDADEDGTISEDEFTAAQERRAERGEGRRHEGGGQKRGGN